MAMAKIAELTQEQIDRFPEFRDKWIEIGLCTDPANRSEAERGIRLAYKCVGLAPPRRIVWTSSPLSNALARISSDQDFGGNVWASVLASVEASVRESVRAGVMASVSYSVRDSVSGSVRDSVMASVWNSVRASVRANVRESVRAGVMASVWNSVRASVRANVRAGVEYSVYGQHEAPWLSFHDYFKEVCGLVKETSKLEGLWLIAKNAGWCLPHENICWISERHNILLRDDAGRLHCEDGPALAYPDGWSIYS